MIDNNDDIKLTLIDVNSTIANQIPIYKKNNKLVETIGYITNIKLKNDKIIIDGAVASFTNHAIDNFIVFLNSTPVPHVICNKNLPHPEFEKAFQDLPLSSQAGFNLELSLSTKEKNNIYDHAFFVFPFIKHIPCSALVGTLIPSHLVPPEQEHIDNVGGNFFIVGFEFLGHLVKYADLLPNHRILDVGCGCGRIAYPLSIYCSEEGSYEGFDIWDAGISWALKNITSKRSNFNFQKVDIYNKRYNPDGIIESADFVFPYRDNSFDIVFLTSVFTHMYAKDVENYIKEIYRVLKKGGKCLLTSFLLNNESVRLMDEGKSSVNFTIKLNNCYTADKDIPEKAIAFDEDWMDNQILKNNFRILLKRYGNWCSRTRYTSYQDIIVITK